MKTDDETKISTEGITWEAADRLAKYSILASLMVQQNASGSRNENRRRDLT